CPRPSSPTSFRPVQKTPIMHSCRLALDITDLPFLGREVAKVSSRPFLAGMVQRRVDSPRVRAWFRGLDLTDDYYRKCAKGVTFESIPRHFGDRAHRRLIRERQIIVSQGSLDDFNLTSEPATPLL